MVAFAQFQSSRLYVADNNRNEGGWWGFVITRDLDSGQDLPPGPLSLKEALESVEWRGTFVYAASAPYPGSNGTLETFIKNVQALIADSSIGGRKGGIIFLPNGAPEQIDDQLKTFILLDRTANSVKLSGSPGLKVNLTEVPGVDLNLDPNSSLRVADSGDWVELTNPTPVATLGGQFAPTLTQPPSNDAQLHFTGTASGAFTFLLSVRQASLYDQTNWGFQLMIPNNDVQPGDTGPLPYISAWFPLAEKGNPQTTLEMGGQVSLVNPRNLIAQAAPTVFSFRGSKTVLDSYYRTNYGKKVKLVPMGEEIEGAVRAGLVINAGYILTVLQHGFRFAPVGDFLVKIDGAKEGVPETLLCGLAGTESIAVLPEIDGVQHGTRLRFVANSPAYVPQFPLKAASPVGPPIDPSASLLDSRFQTSWVSIVAPVQSVQPMSHYTAAPKGAELFGTGAAKVTGLLGPEEPGIGLPATVAFPMFPYAGIEVGTGGHQDMNAQELQQVEREIASPARKRSINSSGARFSASAKATMFARATAALDGDGLVSTTTPVGMIARYSASDGAFKQLLLSQVQVPNGAVTRQMGFVDLDVQLQAAFQTSDQFLVVANNKRLGEAASGFFMPPSSANLDRPAKFFNTINIGDWDFTCNTGTQNQYGDYRSVIVVKGVKGRIFDFDEARQEVKQESLVASPDKWTMKEIFAAPNPPDVSELVTLSNWLVDYCKDAYAKRSNPYFQKFVDIIRDENWTGVLILKAAISKIPSDVAGILSGIKDPKDFYAHHIGLQIGQIDNKTVQQVGTTSMFGLVYYLDPRYDDTQGPHPIATSDMSGSYDFTVLTLKALFENSTIKKFESLAQMILNQIFGSAVTGMVDLKPGGPVPNPYNAVLLEGGVQKNAGAVVYTLSSLWPNRYSLANNILKSVEIDTALMSTRDNGSKSGQIVSWIAMGGFMGFAIIPPIPDDDLPAPFDIFSYGSDSGTDVPRQGLSFNNLGLRIATPVQVSGEDPPVRQLTMVENEITFNSQESRARENSLYKGFQLELLGLLSGNANAEKDADKSDPAKLGYLPAVTQYKLRGVTSGAGGWHGLNFRLNMGTPGALAGKVNLDSALLIAWADDSGSEEGAADFQAMVGIKLPGAGAGGDLFSLQTVIKLSIGLIQLLYVPPVAGNNAKKGGFLLVLNEIALKLLGLLKIPPNGNTAFLLFGDPDAANSTGLGWFAMYRQDQKQQPSA